MLPPRKLLEVGAEIPEKKRRPLPSPEDKKELLHCPRCGLKQLVAWQTSDGIQCYCAYGCDKADVRRRLGLPPL